MGKKHSWWAKERRKLRLKGEKRKNAPDPPFMLRDKMDKEAAPFIDAMIRQGMGAAKIAEFLNGAIPYYRELPLRFHFPGIGNNGLELLNKEIRKRGLEAVLKYPPDEIYFGGRQNRNPGQWSAKKVRALCRRCGLKFLTPEAYGKIAAIHRQHEDKLRYFKREYGPRANRVIPQYNEQRDRDLKRWGNERQGKRDAFEAAIERLHRDAQRRRCA